MIRAVASLIALCYAFLASCIVTDKIDFEDLVNHPPDVLSVEPDNENIQQVCNDFKPAFTLEVWDPDERDASTMAAKLFMKTNPGSATDWTQPRECQVRPLATAGEQAEGLETGVRLTVDCEIDLELYSNLEDELLLIKVQVSDLGYAQSTLPEGTRTAEVLWVYDVLPDWQCD